MFLMEFQTGLGGGEFTSFEHLVFAPVIRADEAELSV